MLVRGGENDGERLWWLMLNRLNHREWWWKWCLTTIHGGTMGNTRVDQVFTILNVKKSRCLNPTPGRWVMNCVLFWMKWTAAIFSYTWIYHWPRELPFTCKRKPTTILGFGHGHKMPLELDQEGHRSASHQNAYFQTADILETHTDSRPWVRYNRQPSLFLRGICLQGGNHALCFKEANHGEPWFNIIETNVGNDHIVTIVNHQFCHDSPVLTIIIHSLI